MAEVAETQIAAARDIHFSRGMGMEMGMGMEGVWVVDLQEGSKNSMAMDSNNMLVGMILPGINSL